MSNALKPPPGNSTEPIVVLTRGEELMGPSNNPLPNPTLERIKVVVVDDHPLVREGIVNLLTQDRRIEVVGEAGGGMKALAEIEEHKPDVVIMDVHMSGISGPDATRKILKLWPSIQIIGLSVQDDPATEKIMREAGAIGFISKSQHSQDIIDAIRNLHPGSI